MPWPGDATSLTTPTATTSTHPGIVPGAWLFGILGVKFNISKKFIKFRPDRDPAEFRRPGEETIMDDKTLRDNFTSGETWTRGLFMVLFAILYSIAEIVVGAVVVFQFVATLLTGRRNDRLLQLGADLSNYIYHCLRFLTYASDDRPYPFSACIYTKFSGCSITAIAAG